MVRCLLVGVLALTVQSMLAQPGQGTVARIGPGVTPPRVIYQADPQYTETARKAKYEGTVTLWLIVDPQGRPQSVRVQRSLEPGLDAKAVEAVKQWRFEPARMNGNPVAVQINVEVHFRLYASPSDPDLPPQLGKDRIAFVVTDSRDKWITNDHVTTVTIRANDGMGYDLQCFSTSDRCSALVIGAHYWAQWKKKQLEVRETCSEEWTGCSLAYIRGTKRFARYLVNKAWLRTGKNEQ